MKNVLFVLILYFAATISAQELITPIPQEVPHDKEKARLGQKLFFDKILSYDRSISCESCHDLQDNITGADTNATSMGVLGRKGVFNSPTVLNAVFNFLQFWDGRAKDLAIQVYGPLFNPIEMAMTDKLLLHRLRSNEIYSYKFNKLYKDGVTIENLIDAIVEFEKTLITPNSRFDRYLRGDSKSLSDDEKKGYALFKNFGCITCHNGVNIGGNMIQKLGIYDSLNIIDEKKYGFNTKDMNKFKVPSLRNVSKTAPYFHNGKVKTLKEAIEIMSGYQLGKRMNKKEKDLIYKFLLTLNGELPKTIYVAK